MTGNKPFSVIFSPAAEGHVEHVIKQLIKDNIAKASTFSNDLRRVRAFLVDNPFMYQDFFAFVKRASLRRSRYNLFYAVDEVSFEVEIVASFHQKESLDRLRERINL